MSKAKCEFMNKNNESCDELLEKESYYKNYYSSIIGKDENRAEMVWKMWSNYFVFALECNIIASKYK